MSHNSKRKIAFNYFGGKYTYCDEIYKHLPDQEMFTHFVELFGGSFVVSLNYEGRVIKTVNEINSDITNFFQVLRDHPYAKQSRKSYNDYKYEFSDEDIIRCADRLHNIKGLAMVSGYECELMNELYKDFRQQKFPIKKNNIRSGSVQEVIWMNY